MYHRELQEIEIEVVWTREETKPRKRRKKDSGDGTTREKKKRRIDAEMDELCQLGHESNRDNNR